MIDLCKVGRLFYSLGILAYGIQQIVIRDFRPQIIPGFPAWAHEHSVFAIVTGAIMIAAAVLISGLLNVKEAMKKKACLYMGFYFLALIPLSHIPYLLFVYPHKLSHLGSWGDVLKDLAFSGGAFVMAGSFSSDPSTRYINNSFDAVLEKMIPVGRIFFCTTIILFGCNHFVYDISTMVPKWFGIPTFWSYFGGAALIMAGTAILFKIFLKPVALLLALMLCLWFLLLHVPNAIAHPHAGRGNEIVSAFDALLFCGTALVLSQSKIRTSKLLFIAYLLGYPSQVNAETHNTINNIKNAALNANGNSVVTASPSLTVSDFDFPLETHDVYHKKLKTRQAGSLDREEFSDAHEMESERNWYMQFSKSSVENNNAGSVIDKPDSTIPIGVIELRNYVIKHGLRDSFIHYFEENFIEPQEALKGYLLGQYRVKGSEDNFCWIRGFKDMRERSRFLPTFYYGPFWKQHKQVANSMLANNDNVYLLKPLLLYNDSLEPAKSITHSGLIPTNGIAIVEFYTANTKLDQLLQLFAKEYIPLLKECGISDCTLFTSVLEENNFPQLPVFQDKNLLVIISFYKNELSYEETMKNVASKMTDDLRARLQDVITIKNTMILYPTEKSTAKTPTP